MCSCRQTGRDALLSEAYGLVWAPDEDNGTVTIPASVLVAPTIGRRSQGHGRASEPWAPSAAIGRFPSCWTFISEGVQFVKGVPKAPLAVSGA